MNLEFLGDALDHWKGALFASLQKEKILRDFAVDPMATDQDSWGKKDREVYARLLRIKQSQVIRHKVSLQKRAKYFGEIAHKGDLFLDPDTGVETPGVKGDRCRYVRPAEIGQLFDRSDERLLIIYQHVRGKRVSDRVEKVLKTLHDEIDQFRCCSYESGTVAMFFLSRLEARTSTVAKHFKAVLGRHANGRIRLSSFQPDDHKSRLCRDSLET